MHAVMTARILLTCAALAAMAAAPTLAAEGQPSPERQATNEPPPKDCTRYNARAGFYGNPWCTPEEQDRFDRWEARRIQKK